MDPRLYNLHGDEKERVANYFEPGMPTDRLEDHDDFGSWKILQRDSDRWLMQHYNRALMWVAVVGSRAMSFEFVTGPDAIALETQLGYQPQRRQ